MKFPRCVVERISMKYGRNLGAFGTKERNEIWAEVGRNSGLRQVTTYFPYVKQLEPGEFRHLEAKKTGYLENPVFLTVSRECSEDGAGALLPVASGVVRETG